MPSLGSYAGRIDTTDKLQRVSVEFFGLRKRDCTRRVGENGAPDVKFGRTSIFHRTNCSPYTERKLNNSKNGKSGSDGNVSHCRSIYPVTESVGINSGFLSDK